MKIITVDIYDGTPIDVAVADHNIDDLRLKLFLKDVEMLMLKKDYIEQDYAKVILAENKEVA